MPANRKSAASVQEMIAGLDANQRAIVEALRALVKKTAPKASESFKWHMPVFEDEGMLCYIAPMKSHVNFGFYQDGSEFDDPKRLLEGTGKKMRHVKLRSTSDIQTALFTKWVQRAVELNHSGQNLMRNRAGKTSGARVEKKVGTSTSRKSSADVAKTSASKSTKTNAPRSAKTNVTKSTEKARARTLQPVSKSSKTR